MIELVARPGLAQPPLHVCLSSSHIDVKFQAENCDKVTLFVIRRKNNAASVTPNMRHAKKPAAGTVKVTLCTDERQRLQGKFVSNPAKRNKFFSQKQQSESGGGGAGGGGVATNPNLVEDSEVIKEALEHGLRHNNLLIDLDFDEVWPINQFFFSFLFATNH